MLRLGLRSLIVEIWEGLVSLHHVDARKLVIVVLEVGGGRPLLGLHHMGLIKVITYEVLLLLISHINNILNLNTLLNLIQKAILALNESLHTRIT